MIKPNFLIPLLCLLGSIINPGLLRAQDTPVLVHRQPAFAGSFYPAGKQALESGLADLFRQAKPVKFDGNIRCMIIPHAGYVYSGKVAASGIASIPRDATYENIFLIASSHREYFEGATV